MKPDEQPGGLRPRNKLPPVNKGGRPKGANSRMSAEARAKAQATGKLPHELLLDWARGQPMVRLVKRLDGDREVWVTEQVPIELEDMKDAAKAAAPYYAPKISTVEVISGVSDADLDEFIARAAAEAGVSVGAGGEGQAQ